MDTQGNLATARSLLERAAAQGAELAVLPEYFCSMGRRDSDKLLLRETPGAGPQAIAVTTSQVLGRT